MERAKPTLLVVEDDIDIADMLVAYFRGQGVEVLSVNWGEDGVRACQTSLPDLVLLDIRLPDIDGFEVARRLRTNRKTSRIPIIFLTEKRERKDRLRGLELQADDYITKPFDIHELGLRVRNALSRTLQQPLSNPITGLPEGTLLDEGLQAALAANSSAFALVTVQNLEKFRELYGFVAADDLLRAAAMMLKDLLSAMDPSGVFLGQFRPGWFVISAPAQTLAEIQDRAGRQINSSLVMFYNEDHRASGLAERQPLALAFSGVVPPAGGFESLAHLNTELARLCR